MKKAYTKKKVEGATFTSNELATFLANRMLGYIRNTDAMLDINDPSCGDGSLLNALSSALETNGICFCISGSDKDAPSVNNTINLLNERFPNIQKQIDVKDFVENRIVPNETGSEIHDVVIANPPYVRTQILGADYAQKIARLYELNGRIDLYYPFLINMTESIRTGGILGVITSNRYLSTKSGASIRQYLFQHYEILEVLDLGDTKLFDAAVLPAIFIGRKREPGDIEYTPAKYLKIYECEPGDEEILSETVFDVLNSETDGHYNVGDKHYELTVGTLERPSADTDIWQLTSTASTRIISTIEQNSSMTISDLFKVRVGVKSCADEVFFKQDYGEHKPEPEWLRAMVSQENIQKWSIEDNLTKVIYPHYNNAGKKAVLDIEEFPEAKAFLLKYEDRLKQRSYLLKAKRNWYEYWVPQNPVLWGNLKLVWADISVEPRFAIDNTGSIVNGNCYWICAESKEQEELLYLIMGIANSKLIEIYHDMKFNNKLYSGRRRYLSQYVEQYPIPDLNSEAVKDIIKHTKKLVSTSDKKKRDQLEAKIESSVRRAFGFTD